ncbi:MAG TPA: hypothetical protein VMW70_09895 [Burkholderiales bacterium]|nr:hypothetical protein [Burkholderiales bacterium]
MTNADVHEELLRLRKQVAELAAARRKHKAATKEEEEDPAMGAGQEQAEQTIREQIEDLAKLLQEEVRDMPALPTLGVFMLGVLVGRYLR